MSQVCPSSSHQLVAAAIAFQRARRKFPKNYGLSGNSEGTSKSLKAESITANEDLIHQGDFISPPTRCTNMRPSHVCATTAWSDERGENTSIKENLLQKPIICSCCRKRNEAAKVNEPSNISKPRDECSAGDALDTVPSREYNRLATPIAKTNDPHKSEQQEKYDVDDAKIDKSSEMKCKDFTRRRALCSYPQRRSPNETSKLDSINLLYDRHHEGTDNVKYCNSLSERNWNTEKYNCDFGRKDYKPTYRGSQSKLDSFASPRNNLSFSTPCTCDFHSVKHSSLDLLRPHQDYRRLQSYHRSGHHHDHCHRRYFDEEYTSCSSKEKPYLMSDTCLCPTSSCNNQRLCTKIHGACHSARTRSCCLKDSEKISTVQEQNDEEYDDCVGVINHKDSLCILVEKYKASKKCKHKKIADELNLSDERNPDECNKSLISEISYQQNTNENTGTAEQREKPLDDDTCRPRENRASIGKNCRHGCGQIFREGDSNPFKNLRSRLIKTGTCCSPKGTPWRHTF